jgi:hypothetical protein
MTAATKTNGRTPRVLAAAEHEPQPGGLATALLAFAAEAPKLRRDAVGQIQSRTYPYATLDSLLDDVTPLLVKHELLWTAKVIREEGDARALYRMEHVPSGESDEWTGPLPCVEPGPQNLGSAITYMRRYTLQAYLNLAPGEDDDGVAASPPAPVDRYAQAESGGAVPAPQGEPSADPRSPQPVARPPQPSERRITANQRTKLLIPRARKAKLTDGEFANVIYAAAGKPTRTWRSEEHASQTLDRLLDQLPARLKDVVLEGIDAAGKAKP